MRPRRGLTLVELLASLAIAAMLAAAALGVTTALARSELALRRAQGGPETLAAALKALLEMDLVHAHHWRPVEGGFALQTTARLAGPTLRLEHVPAEVTYCVVRTGDGAYLVRIQETPPEPPTSELGAVGVSAAAIVPEKDVRPNRFGWRSLESGAAVRVTFEGELAGGVTVRLTREGTLGR